MVIRFMKKIITKYKDYILTIIIPLTIILLVYIINNIYPFGDKVIAHIDGYSQYPGLLSNLINTIKNKNSLYYSFKGLLGFNTYASMIYYTFNITNLLAFFFKNIMSFYNFIVPIKICLSSLTMLVYLNYNNKNKTNYLFSICYSLCAYNILYYFNYMWFDSVIMFPLVILGIDKIFKENKYHTYLITLTLAILFNFYIGYMICIFSVIYFIYKTIINGYNKEKLIKYTISSLLSGLLTSFALLPVILELLNGKASLISEFSNNYFKFDLDFLNIFYKLTFSSFSNGDLEYGTPNVYISIFAYINSAKYFFNKNITLKERLASLGVVLFFLLSVSFNLLDYSWHMLSMPIYYPVRYSFIISFFLIYLSFRNYNNPDKKSLIFNIIFYTSFILIILLGFYTSGNLSISERQNLIAKLIYLGISFIFILYYSFMQNNNNYKNYICYILIIELFFNTLLSFKNIGNTNTYSNYTNTYNNTYNTLNKINDSSIYRVGIYNKTIVNNGLLLNYNDLSYFSSIRNNNVINFLENNLEFNITDKAIVKYYYNNVIINSLLGIKYIISPNELNYYDKIDNNLYINNDATSIGFITSNNLLNINNNSNLNDIVKLINNNDKNIMEELNYTKKTINCNQNSNVCILSSDKAYIEYNYTANKDEFIFINDNNYYESTYTTLYNDKEVYIENKEFILLHKGDTINFKIYLHNKGKDYNIKTYLIDYKLYKEFINNINKNKLEITNYYNDSHFIGEINLEEEGLLLTTISNDKGWNIYVDGKKTKQTNINNALLALELDKGQHTIEFKYTVPGLKTGTTITLITLIIILLNKNKYRLK